MQSLVGGREDVITFREIDLSKDRAAVSTYGIQATPTVIIYDAQGQEIDRFVGIPDEGDVAGAIEEAVSP